MLSKESKIRVLENFYALDYIFFGKPASKVTTCCPLVKEEYLSIKGALLSVYTEMLKLVDHQPATIKEAVDSKGLMKNAISSAKIARENSQKIVSSEKAKANIKGMLKEALQKDSKADVTSLVEKSIRTKAFTLAVDNLLIARSLKESKSFNKLDEWEGQIIEDSYKVLRDSLVEAAYMMLYSEAEETEKEDEKEEEKMNEEWYRAIAEDIRTILKSKTPINLDEAMTQYQRNTLFTRINRLFGECAKKCGRIARSPEARTCKEMCIAKRDKAIRIARAKAKSEKAAAKGKTAKAEKYASKAKQMQNY